MAKKVIDLRIKEDCFAYFGFGSLVNRATLPDDIVGYYPATLNGWERHWQQRPSSQRNVTNFLEIALLSIHRNAQMSIDGALIVDRISNLSVLDEREQLYQKIRISIDDISFENNDVSIFDNVKIYTYVAPISIDFGSDIYILRSYLDVVMQGFLSIYGINGIKRFINSTEYMNTSVYDDRGDPIYPRHQKLSLEEITLFDRLIASNKRPMVEKSNFGKF